MATAVISSDPSIFYLSIVHGGSMDLLHADPDFCNGNERWYYLNSGTESAYVGSYSNQKLIFHRPSASAFDGGLPFGKRIGLVRAGKPAQCFAMYKALVLHGVDQA